jgi:hypothetical protein
MGRGRYRSGVPHVTFVCNRFYNLKIEIFLAIILVELFLLLFSILLVNATEEEG